MKETSIKESTIMSTFTLDVLYSKLETHKLDILALKHGSKSASQSTKLHYDNSSTSIVLSFFPENSLPILSTRFTKALQNSTLSFDMDHFQAVVNGVT
jgi:hypothetical protein